MIKSLNSIDTSAAPLEVSHLVKTYDSGEKKVEAVKDVSFKMSKGEIFGLLGPNGAGKTSIISTIVTLEKPTSGQVKVFGLDVEKEARLAKLMTGWVPQEIINHGFFNVEEILGFHSGYYGMKLTSEYKKYLLDSLALWPHRHKKVRQLSGGMKRRLMIAKALVHRPQLLLLDEPTAGVDIELRTSLWKFVEELRDQGVSVLLTTHYLEEAEQLCDRVAIIHHGKIRRLGKTTEIIKDLTRQSLFLIFKGDMPPVQHDWVRSQSRHDQFTHLNLSVPMGRDICDVFSNLGLNMNQLVNIKISEGNLEDAFKLIVEGEK